MIQWQKLDEKVLHTLKDGRYFLVYCGWGGDSPVDIIYFEDQEHALMPEEQRKYCWRSLKQCEGLVYRDYDMLDIFKHYSLIEEPGDND